MHLCCNFRKTAKKQDAAKEREAASQKETLTSYRSGKRRGKSAVFPVGRQDSLPPVRVHVPQAATMPEI